MADFGDESLFEEFESDRQPTGSFIKDKTSIIEKQYEDTSDQCSTGDDPSSTVSTETSKIGNVSNKNNVECGYKHDQPNTNLLDRLKFLENENQKLISYLKLLDTARNSKTDAPFVQVLFLNNTISRKYRGEIEKFMAIILDKEKYETSDKLPSIQLKTHHKRLTDLMGNDKREKLSKQFVDSSAVIGCAHFYKDFYVDHVGWPLVNYRTEVTDGLAIPYYIQVYKDVLPCEEEDSESPGPRRSKATCFNCGGEHVLSDCLERKDFKRISSNKRRFLEKGSSLKNNSRYHIENDPRFSKFKAGIISPELRQALNLRDDELPPYIYYMRRLGYPPGHILDAQESTSGIALFDADGRDSQDDDKPKKGETAYWHEDISIDKVPDYPGFNMNVPDGVVDDCRRFNLPPMLPMHMKKTILEQKKGLKRHNSVENGLSTSKKAKLSDLTDMDLDDTGIGKGKKDAPPRATSTRIDSSCPTPSSQSESDLDDLEEQRKLLLAQLASVEGSTEVEMQILDDYSSQTDDSNDNSPFALPSGASTPVYKGKPSRHGETGLLQDDSRSSFYATPSAQESISVEFGTPVVDDLDTSTLSLPTPDKFSAGIAQHIPYENLPDATGTFKRLKCVLKNIRSRKSK